MVLISSQNSVILVTFNSLKVVPSSTSTQLLAEIASMKMLIPDYLSLTISYKYIWNHINVHISPRGNCSLKCENNTCSPTKVILKRNTISLVHIFAAHQYPEEECAKSDLMEIFSYDDIFVRCNQMNMKSATKLVVSQNHTIFYTTM